MARVIELCWEAYAPEHRRLVVYDLTNNYIVTVVSGPAARRALQLWSSYVTERHTPGCMARAVLEGPAAERFLRWLAALGLLSWSEALSSEA